MPRDADAFARSTEEQATNEAYWLGFTDGLDEEGASPVELGGPLRGSYLEGYYDGFYERKQAEVGSRGLLLAVSMGYPRRLGFPWWRNYTRGGGTERGI